MSTVQCSAVVMQCSVHSGVAVVQCSGIVVVQCIEVKCVEF